MFTAPMHVTMPCAGLCGSLFWSGCKLRLQNVYSAGPNFTARFTTFTNIGGCQAGYQTMDKLQLAGQNLGQVFNSRSGCMCAMHLCCYEAKRPNLKLQTCPKQLLGSLMWAFALPNQTVFSPGSGHVHNISFSSQLTNWPNKLLVCYWQVFPS